MIGLTFNNQEAKTSVLRVLCQVILAGRKLQVAFCISTWQRTPSGVSFCRMVSVITVDTSAFYNDNRHQLSLTGSCLTAGILQLEFALAELEDHRVTPGSGNQRSDLVSHLDRPGWYAGYS